MTLEDFIKSRDFSLFLDETLRDQAIKTVKRIRSTTNKPVKLSQLHVIPSVIQGSGLEGLRELAKNQMGKNTKQENKDFWSAIHTLLSEPDKSELTGFLNKFMIEKKFLRNPEAESEKTAQKQARKRNKQILDGFMEEIIGVYFEHFNCHYFCMKD